MYNYFVSFSHMGYDGNNLGFGQSIVTRKRRIVNSDDIKRLNDELEKETELKNIVILNFILLH